MNRRLVGEATGGPLGATIAGAKGHDPTWLAATREAIVVARPQPTEARPPHLCLDHGDDKPTGYEAVAT